MSKPFDASRANTLPMDELCTLIGVERTLNANGYDETRTETEREGFCGFAQFFRPVTDHQQVIAFGGQLAGVFQAHSGTCSCDYGRLAFTHNSAKIHYLE